MFERTQRKDDFQVTVQHRGFSDEWNKILSKRIGRVDMDLVNRTLMIKVHQLKKGIVQDILFSILENGGYLDQVSIRPAKGAQKGYEYLFVNGQITGHRCEYNYGKKEDLNHAITIKFEQVTLKSPTLDKRTDITLRERPVHVHEVPPGTTMPGHSHTRQVLMEG